MKPILVRQRYVGDMYGSMRKTCFFQEGFYFYYEREKFRTTFDVLKLGRNLRNHLPPSTGARRIATNYRQIKCTPSTTSCCRHHCISQAIWFRQSPRMIRLKKDSPLQKKCRCLYQVQLSLASHQDMVFSTWLQQMGGNSSHLRCCITALYRWWLVDHVRRFGDFARLGWWQRGRGHVGMEGVSAIVRWVITTAAGPPLWRRSFSTVSWQRARKAGNTRQRCAPRGIVPSETVIFSTREKTHKVTWRRQRCSILVDLWRVIFKTLRGKILWRISEIFPEGEGYVCWINSHFFTFLSKGTLFELEVELSQVSCLGQQAQPPFSPLLSFRHNDSLHTIPARISARKVKRGSDVSQLPRCFSTQILQEQRQFLEMVNRTRGGAAFQLQLLGIMCEFPIIKLSIWGGQSWCKCKVKLRDFPFILHCLGW